MVADASIGLHGLGIVLRVTWGERAWERRGVKELERERERERAWGWSGTYGQWLCECGGGAWEDDIASKANGARGRKGKARPTVPTHKQPNCPDRTTPAILSFALALR